MKSIQEIQTFNEHRRTGECVTGIGNNSFPGKVKHPPNPTGEVKRGTMDDSGEAKEYKGDDHRAADGAFTELEHKLSHEKGVTDPAGLAAHIGMEKMGKGAFEEKANEGREH
jgi:hypothetical protein